MCEVYCGGEDICKVFGIQLFVLIGVVIRVVVWRIERYYCIVIYY